MKTAIVKCGTIFLLLYLAVDLIAQVSGGAKAASVERGLGKAWKGPSSSVIGRLFISGTHTRSVVSKNTVARPAVKKPARIVPNDPIVFRPTSNSGVAQSLIDALASNATERQGLTVLFGQIKRSYETEVAKEGKSNNLAAALTFFVASSIMAYNDSPEPSDAIVENFYNSLGDTMRVTPEFTQMSNTEKQQMHDWLVLMGGFILASHMDAKQRNDAEALKNSKLLAYYAFRILGIDPNTLNFVSSRVEPYSQPASNISTWSPTFNSPPAFSAIRFCPNSTFPSKFR
jgi:hypothetical protein